QPRANRPNPAAIAALGRLCYGRWCSTLASGAGRSVRRSRGGLRVRSPKSLRTGCLRLGLDDGAPTSDAPWTPIRTPESNVEANPLYPAGTLRIQELTAEERAVYATLKPERLPEHVAIIRAPRPCSWLPKPPPASAFPGSPSTLFLWKITCAAHARKSTSSCASSK